jgi:nucleoid-associated protein YgaU
LRTILYILFAVGGILVVLALSMVFLDDEVAQLKPQSQAIELATPEIVQGVTDTSDQLTAKSESPAVQQGTDASSPLKIDIARVKPDGAAVFAGTAAGNASIRIFEGKVLLGNTVANSAGEWVIVLERSLAVGQHLISIVMEREDGSTAFSDLSLAVEIYEDSETKPLVALLPETSTEVPVLIQSPDDGSLATSNTSGTGMRSSSERQQVNAGSAKTTNDSGGGSVDRTKPTNQVKSRSVLAAIAPIAIVWRDAEHILISGTSQGGVRVIANDTNDPFGEALVLADGTWQIAGSLNLEKIKHYLKFALMNDSDKVIAIYTLPLTSRDLAKGQNGSPLVIVNKGDALWRIAYRQFGDGIRYVDIVRRNQQDIVDPDLIYPKQIFAVPKSTKDAIN